MYCGVCGKENQDGCRFCRNCGAQLIAPEVFENELLTQDGRKQYNPNGGQQYDAYESDPFDAPGKGGKKKVIIVCSAAAVAAVAFIGGFMMTGKTTIDLNDYIRVTTDGYNGYGTADITFDSDALADDYEEKLEKAYNKNSSSLESLLGSAGDSLGMNVYAGMLESYCISYEADCAEGLSNGDTITITWECDDETAKDQYGCSLNYSTITYTVSGLEETGAFNPFEDIDVSFSGTDTEGTADYEVKDSADEAAEALTYSFDKSSGLSNGDTVTLTVSCSADDVEAYCAENYGTVPSALEMTYTVAGLEDEEEEEEETAAADSDDTSVTVIHVTPDNGYTYNYIRDDNAHYYYDGQLFPESSYVKLTESEVESLTTDEIQDAINEIYARNGYIFNTDSILEYYSQFAWYEPTYSADYFNSHRSSILNSVELANVNLLAKERDSR